MGGWRDFHEVSITPADGCMSFFLGVCDCVVIYSTYTKQSLSNDVAFILGGVYH